jgi:hypothetical protein
MQRNQLQLEATQVPDQQKKPTSVGTTTAVQVANMIFRDAGKQRWFAVVLAAVGVRIRSWHSCCKVKSSSFFFCYKAR